MNELFHLIGSFFLHPDFLHVLVWWLALAGVGVLFLPLTLRLFAGFHDGGYLFARVLGLLLSAWLAWFASSLGLAPFGRTTVAASLLLFGVLNYALPSSRSAVRDFFRHKARTVVAEEYLFLLAFLAWAFLRSLKPDIDGLEKFMNLGFVNAVLRAEWMPPVDMWMAGESVNYYYFGHVATASLSLLTRIPPEIAYNLMIATLFALAFSLSYSVVSCLLLKIDPRGAKKAVAGGLLAALLLAAGGNLHPFVYGVVRPALQRAGVLEGEPTSYWYPQARSFIGHHPPTGDKGIHEFPFYSFVISDLHGHVLDVPASLTATGLGAALLLSQSAASGTSPIRVPYREAVAGVLLGTTWMTNSWNYPIYLLVLAGAALVFALQRHGFTRRALAETLFAAVVLLVVSQAAALPYTLNFQNMTRGVHRVMATSPLWQLAILWGYQLFFAGCFALFCVLGARRLLRERDESAGRLHTMLDRTPPSDIVALGMFAAAVCLLLMPEIVYVKDIYGTEYHRANTMFKLTFQAFIFFALGSGYAAARIAGALARPWRRATAWLVFLATAAMPMTYAYWAVPGFYGQILTSGSCRGLDGIAFLSPDDREIVRWFNENVSGQTPILEADGASYTKYGRISMATGLPTPLGWHAHEWLWRGSPDGPNERQRDVRMLYESDDSDATSRLLRRYGIRYVVLGALEREKFTNIKEAKLEGMGRVVADFPGGSKIVEIDAEALRSPDGGAGETSP